MLALTFTLAVLLTVELGEISPDGIRIRRESAHDVFDAPPLELENPDWEAILTAGPRTVKGAVARGETPLSPEIRSTLAEISAVPALTPRQQEILSFVKRGLTNQDISKALSISADAVKQHLGAICRKLGAANRTEAVALAMRPPFAASCDPHGSGAR